MATGAAPFDSFQIADTGDVALNTYNLEKSIDLIEAHFDSVLAGGAKTRGHGRRSHHHAADPACPGQAARSPGAGARGCPRRHERSHVRRAITHGTIFRRAIEEGLIDPNAMVQIGLRATGYAADDFDWARQRGVRVVPAEECWYRSLAPLMAEVRDQIGSERPVYLSFDIDGLDPSVAPGTGTPEPAGLSASPGHRGDPRRVRPQPGRQRSRRGVAALRHHG
jgi:guanidinobutyrase